jgi:hypothetical protein
MSTRTSSRLLSLFAASTLAFPLLTGCGMGHIDTTTLSPGFHGKVFGGQQPIGQSTITVWQAGTTDYGTGAAQLDQVQSDNNGNFTFPADDYTCPTPDTQVYITAAGGNPSPGIPNPNVLLAAGLGNCATAQQQFVIINEVTTAATAYALGRFLDPAYTSSGTSGFGAPPADANYIALSNTHTIPMLVDLPSGTARPSGDGVTREDTRLNTIANILAACVNNASLCANLFNNTNNIDGNTPRNTLQAAVSMSLMPTQNVSNLFRMPTGTPPFTGLSTQPDDFFLSIAYTSSNFGLSINSAYPGGSSSSIDIASDGRVFFPSNASGKTGIGVFDPSLGGFGSLLLPNILTLPQYVGVDPLVGNIFATDLGSGTLAGVSSDYSTTSSGAIASDASSSAAIVLPSNAPIVSETTTSGTTNLMFTFPGFPMANHVLTTLTAPATGISSSDANFLAMTSGASTPCMLEKVDTTDGGTTFTDAIDQQTTTNCRTGGIFSIFGSGYGIASSTNQICVSADIPADGSCSVDPFLDTPQGIALDGNTTIWGANSGNASVYVSGVPVHGAFLRPTTLFNPYGIAIDGSGNVWLSNAGCTTATTIPCAPGPFTLTEFIGAAIPAITPLGDNCYGNYTGSRPMAHPHPPAQCALTPTPGSRLSVPTNIPAPWSSANASH